MTTRIARSLLALTVLAAGAVALRHLVAAEEEAAEARKPAPATTEGLGGEERFLTHLATDKPIYKVGETVYLRGVMLEANDRKPLPKDGQVMAMVEILGPKGDVVASSNARTEESVLGFAWKVPEGQAGGEYTAKVTHPWTGHPPAERKFDVRVYRAPRLKTQIEFVRDGYGPGDTVAASLHVERAEGGVPEGAKVNVVGRVDGRNVFNSEMFVNAAGDATTRFELPAEIARGEGTLAFVVEDGGVIETASKTIPILLQTVDLQTFPEGGELVAGLANRVYLEARTPANKPADLAGTVVNGEGEQVAEFRTEHEGRGRFAFTPAKGETYELRITEPSGIKTSFPLPEVQPDGVVLASASIAFQSDESPAVTVTSTETRKVTVTLKQRETELASKTITVEAGKPAEVAFDEVKDASGVLIATVWADDETPLAERLLFRRPSEAVEVTIEADREQYVPGGKTKLTVRTTDETGEPISAVVGLTVTDDSVLEMIETREQAPRLPVMVLLEDDVRELADAHVYLDPENPEAPQAVDLLLGTQGWRRFALVDPAKFVEEHADDARRVLALRMPSRRERGRAHELRLLQRNPGAPVPLAAAVEDAAEADAAPGEAKEEAAPAAPPADAAKQPPADADFADEAAAPELQRALDRADAKKEAADKLAVLGDRRRNRKPANFVVVREYAHEVRENRQPNQRTDFTETLYWNAGLKTDETGTATVEFGLSDSVTSFRAMADAFDFRGALGQATETVESVEPLYVEPKMPLQVTSGDVIRLPLGVVNATTGPLSNAELTMAAKGVKIDVADATLPGELPADARLRQLVNVDTTGFSGSSEVTLGIKAGGYADRVTRSLDVQPLGFPIEIGRGGMLEADSTIEREIVVPDQIVPGSVTTEVKVFPSPLASMTAALERLIREPNGCFEQTSSSTYPLVMAQQYFQTHSGVDPKLIARSDEMLAKGYDRLIGYECKSGGYEWFGEDPGHEALTAYGLMEFQDMARVREVDSAMIERTREWLLGQRDGEGGFKRERRALHTWLADEDVSNAYVTWALLNAGIDADELAKEIDTVEKAAEKTENSYVLALAANVMIQSGRKDAANRMMDRLFQLQAIDGSIPGATTSIVGSGGDALVIETTALATLAFTSDIDYVDFADKGVRYLTETCKAGRYGSTQSTILALKAIVEFDKKLAKPKAAGSVQLAIDGEKVGEPVAFDEKTDGAILLPDVTKHLTAGKHTVALTMTDGSNMPFAVTVNLHSTKPASSDACKLAIDVALVDDEFVEGGVTEARVTVSNETDEAVPTPIAIVGVPGGLEVRHDQLKELVEAGTIAAYEVLGREVVLYWRDMAAGAKVELPLSLVAAVPGQYTGPASRAYLYYTDEDKQWVDPLRVAITPRN